MQPITFRYNSFRIGPIIIFSFLVIIFLVAMAVTLNDPNEWLIFIPVAIIIFCIIRFFILNFWLPMFKGKPALLLDEEKLVSIVQDEIIHWKDVDKFSKHEGLSYGYILFEMKDGEFIRIGTKWVDLSIKDLYKSVESFMVHDQPSKLA